MTLSKCRVTTRNVSHWFADNKSDCQFFWCVDCSILSVWILVTKFRTLQVYFFIINFSFHYSAAVVDDLHLNIRVFRSSPSQIGSSEREREFIVSYNLSYPVGLQNKLMSLCGLARWNYDHSGIKHRILSKNWFILSSCWHPYLA